MQPRKYSIINFAPLLTSRYFQCAESGETVIDYDPSLPPSHITLSQVLGLGSAEPSGQMREGGGESQTSEILLPAHLLTWPYPHPNLSIVGLAH